MIFKFTLTDEANVSKVISEPGGWDKSTIGFERHPDFHSLVEYFKGSFQTYGSNGVDDGGRDWILQREKLYGADADLKVLIELDIDNNGSFEMLYEGQVTIGLIIESLDNTGHLLEVVFTQNSFWTRFINRYKNQVDLRSTVDLDGNTVSATPKFTLPLPSQVIDKSYVGYNKYNQLLRVEHITNPVMIFGFDTETLKEIGVQSSLQFQALAGDGTAYPQADQVLPMFNFEDGGELIIQNVLLTISAYDFLDQPEEPTRSDFEATTNVKADRLPTTQFEVFLQINNETPILFSQSDRTVPSSFTRNDGVTETLIRTKVTDFSLASNYKLTIKKGDAFKIYGVYTYFSPPTTILRGFLCLWGRDGWSHESGYDQIIGGVGSYWSWNSTEGTFPQNRGTYAWGGYYDASVNAFPSSIDDDAGTGQAILAGNWWNIVVNGVLGGVPVTEKNIITAKVDNPTNSLSDWNIGTLTPLEGLEAYGSDNGLNILFNTSLPDTTTEAFLTHDVAAGILDRVAGQTGLFYSEYLGNPYTSRVYGAVGCGSLLANMRGLHLRGYLLTDKPFFASFEDWWLGINPIHNLGLGYDKVSGDDVIRVEEKAKFYDDSGVSINLANVFKIKRVYDAESQFNQITQGYEKWQSQAASGVGTPSGIDDPQSSRNYASRFKKIGKQFKNLSKWIAASLTLETTRRIGNLQSANYTYDNETFVIALKNNGDGTFQPELDENFSAISNLRNSATRYNNRLTPARNFLRWLNYYSGCLQSYLSSVFRFTGGDGNFSMTSTMTTTCAGDDTGVNVDEKGNISVVTDFLHTDQLYEIEHYLDWEGYKLIRNARNKAIGISQTEANYKKFFIKTLDYQIVSGLIKLQAWAKEPFDITVPDSPASEHPSNKYYERPGYGEGYE